MHIVLFCLLLLPFFVTSSFSADWYNSSWQKRIPLNITNINTASTLTGYQVFLSTTIFNSAQWNDIKGGTGKPDLSDVRFTKNNGVTPLNYCLALDTAGPEGFWVKFDGELPTGTTGVYMYYGNQNAVPASSGPLTFEFFDDFQESTFTFRSHWTTIETEWSVENGTAAHQQDPSGWTRYLASDSGQVNAVLETKIMAKANTGGNFICVFIRGEESPYNATNIIQFVLNCDVPIEFQYIDHSSSKTTISPGPKFDKWYRIKIAHDNENIKVYVDSGTGYDLKVTSITDHTTGTHIGFGGRFCESYVDYIFQRKYSPVEPTTSVLGNIEVYSPSTESIVVTTDDDRIRVGVPVNSVEEDWYIIIDTSVSSNIIDEATSKAETDWGYKFIPDTICECRIYDKVGNKIAPTFANRAVISITYTSPTVSVNELGVCCLDTSHSLWMKLPSTIDTDNKRVSAEIEHLSIFALVTKSANTEDDIFAYPVPWRPNANNPDRYGTKSGGIIFTNLPNPSRIKIYNIAGELVKEILHTKTDPDETWYGKTGSGRDAASGVYVYVVEFDSKRKHGKLMIIR